MVKQNAAGRITGQDRAASAKPRVAEGHPVDLFRERTRYYKRASNNYQLGSNIPCLLSHDLDPKEPPKPSIRVRDIGRDIMINANKCSWYQGMMEGSEVEDQGRRRSQIKSRTTQSVFPSEDWGTSKEDQGNAPPNPDQNDPSPKPTSGESSGKPVPSDSSLVVDDKVDCDDPQQAAITSCTEATPRVSNSTCSEAICDANLVLLRRLEEQQLEMMKQQQALCKQLGRQIAGSQDDSKVTDATENASSVQPPVSMQPEPQPAAQPKSQSVVSTALTDTTSIEETSVPMQTSTLTSIIPSASMARYDVASLRRLKGAVAQRCAQRDEGSIKNLIWCQEEDQDEDDDNNNKHGRLPKGGHQSFSHLPRRDSIIPIGDSPPFPPPQRTMRQSCAVKAESSKTVQDLLKNSFSYI